MGPLPWSFPSLVMDPPSQEPQTEPHSSHCRPPHSCLRGATVNFNSLLLCPLLYSIYAHRTYYKRWKVDYTCLIISFFAAVNHYQNYLTIKIHRQQFLVSNRKSCKAIGFIYDICKAMRYLGIIWTETKRSISNVYGGGREAGRGGLYRNINLSLTNHWGFPSIGRSRSWNCHTIFFAWLKNINNKK